jgi:hypothetical protein
MAMFAILNALDMFVADLVTSRSRLEAEILFLRHQSASGGRLLDLNRAESSCFDGLADPALVEPDRCRSPICRQCAGKRDSRDAT